MGGEGQMGVLPGPNYGYVFMAETIPNILLSSTIRFFQADPVSHFLLRPLHVLRHAYSYYS